MGILAIPRQRVSAPLAIPASVTRRASTVKALLVAADGVVIAAALFLAYTLRSILPGNDPASAPDQHFLLGALSLPVWLLLFSHYRLYIVRAVARRLEEFRGVVHAVGAGVVGSAVVGFMLKWYVSRGWLVLSFAIGVTFVTIERETVRQVFCALRRRGQMLRPVVIVGGNAEGVALCGMLMKDRSLGYHVVGFVDDHNPAESFLYDHRPVLGTVEHTLDAVQRCGATSVIIVTTAVDFNTSNRLARQLTDAGIHVELSLSLRDIASQRLTVGPLGRFPVVHVEPVQRHGWRAVAKRALDLAVAGFGLVVSLPLLAVLAIAIKIDSRGPVFFRQQRVGRNGVPFAVFKLRTMVVDAESLLVDLRDANEAGGPLFKMADDPRITRLGRILRKLSLDELPQLWNVIRGDMSLVGPRPALPQEMAHWSPELHNRLRVKPGITGMWQVSRHANWSFDDYVRLDLYYVDNWSLLTDLAIAAKTIPTLFRSSANK